MGLAVVRVAPSLAKDVLKACHCSRRPARKLAYILSIKPIQAQRIVLGNPPSGRPGKPLVMLCRPWIVHTTFVPVRTTTRSSQGMHVARHVQTRPEVWVLLVLSLLASKLQVSCTLPSRTETSSTPSPSYSPAMRDRQLRPDCKAGIEHGARCRTGA
jgi:hypothetical protein